MEPSSAGMLISGTTCPDEGSALLQAAGHAGMVTGQVIIMTDFTDSVWRRLRHGSRRAGLCGHGSDQRPWASGIREDPGREGAVWLLSRYFGAVLWDEKHR